MHGLFLDAALAEAFALAFDLALAFALAFDLAAPLAPALAFAFGSPFHLSEKALFMRSRRSSTWLSPDSSQGKAAAPTSKGGLTGS